MPETSIQLQNVAIGYKNKKEEKCIASGISASICSGELTCLLGANGAGKSTLLRTLSNFQPTLKGTVFLNKKSINQIPDRQFSKLLGVVLTERFDIRNMSVYELIAMGRSPYTGFWGRLNNDDRQIIDSAIQDIHIEDLRNRMVHTLSDGERQKVMIAKTLAQQTPIIFLDEPTAFLDYPSKVDIMQLLHQLSRKANKTIFLSTHDLELALQIADKIWLMKKEQPMITGSPEDLAMQGALEKFIQREGIQFDICSGLFRIKHHHSRMIHVTGELDRIPFVMLKKALDRNGIEIETKKTTGSDLTIEVLNEYKGFLIHKKDVIIEKTVTIEKTLEAIYKLIIEK